VEVQVDRPPPQRASSGRIARANPADLESLAAVEGMDPFRIEQYGPAILEVLQSEPRQQTLI